MSDEQITPDDPEVPTVEDEASEDEQDKPDWVPPTREEWEALQAKAKKSNEDAKRNRKLRTELQQQNESDTDKVAREATEAAAAKYKPVAIKAAAKAAFLEQGANSARIDRLFRMLDLDSIEFDGEDITGLEEQVNELKADVPELFTAPGKSEEDDQATNPKAPKLSAAGRKPAAQQLTPGDIVARQVLGR